MISLRVRTDADHSDNYAPWGNPFGWPVEEWAGAPDVLEAFNGIIVYGWLE